MTQTNALATLGLVLAASVAACSYLVDADRSKVTDTLYQPTAMEAGPAQDGGMGDGGTTDGSAGDAGGDGSSGGDASGDAGPADATAG